MKDSNGGTNDTCKDFTSDEWEYTTHLYLFQGFTSHYLILCDICAICQDSQMEFKFSGKTKDYAGHVIKGIYDCDDADYAASCRFQCGGCTPPTSAPMSAPTSAPTIECGDSPPKMRYSAGKTKKTYYKFTSAECEDSTHLALYVGFTLHCHVICNICAICQDSK